MTWPEQTQYLRGQEVCADERVEDIDDFGDADAARGGHRRLEGRPEAAQHLPPRRAAACTHACDEAPLHMHMMLPYGSHASMKPLRTTVHAAAAWLTSAPSGPAAIRTCSLHA